MKRHVYIIDTNVVVAGLLTGNSQSSVAQTLDGMLAATFPFALSEALLAEYRAVLVQTNLRKLHRLTVAEIDFLLTDIAQHAIVLMPAASELSAPDPGDQLLWNLLAVRADLLLVTGDKRLIEDAGMKGRVMSPRDFVSDST